MIKYTRPEIVTTPPGPKARLLILEDNNLLSTSLSRTSELVGKRAHGAFVEDVDGNIFLEAFHDLYTSAYDFLVAIAEPVARPEFLHQYKLTPYSLYAAVATNIDTEAIISVLERLSKNALPKEVKKFVRDCTQKVRFLL